MTVKTVKVNFGRSLPLGSHGTFVYEKQHWIAFPADKYSKIIGLIDRLIGVHHAIGRDMTHWINERPQDAVLIARVLERVGRARLLHRELIMDKTIERTK